MSPAIVRGETEPQSASTIARHIAREAARLFAARGYDATSVREIVEAAGVTKPTLYYHFGSKEGLAQALVTRPLDELCLAMRRILDEPPFPGEPRHQIERLLDVNFAFVRDDPDRARFVYALFFGPLGLGLAAELAGFAERIDTLWDDAFARLAERGVIAPDRVADATAALRGLVMVHTADFLYRNRPLGPDAPRRLVANLLSGFSYSI